MDTKGHEGDEGGERRNLNHETHEKHEKARNDVGRDDSEPRMDTNGHEWAKGERGRGDLNHEIHENTRKKHEMTWAGMIQNHEWRGEEGI